MKHTRKVLKKVLNQLKIANLNSKIMRTIQDRDDIECEIIRHNIDHCKQVYSQKIHTQKIHKDLIKDNEREKIIREELGQLNYKGRGMLKFFRLLKDTD